MKNEYIKKTITEDNQTLYPRVGDYLVMQKFADKTIQVIDTSSGNISGAFEFTTNDKALDRELLDYINQDKPIRLSDVTLGEMIVGVDSFTITRKKNLVKELSFTEFKINYTILDSRYGTKKGFSE